MFEFPHSQTLVFVLPNAHSQRGCGFDRFRFKSHPSSSVLSWWRFDNRQEGERQGQLISDTLAENTFKRGIQKKNNIYIYIYTEGTTVGEWCFITPYLLTPGMKLPGIEHTKIL